MKRQEEWTYVWKTARHRSQALRPTALLCLCDEVKGNGRWRSRLRKPQEMKTKINLLLQIKVKFESYAKEKRMTHKGKGTVKIADGR